MAWYQVQGPNAEYVRNHQLTVWEKKIGKAQICESTRELIKHILKIHIPDSLTDFGSYRGYATFGLLMRKRTEIENHLIRQLDARRRAKDKLSQKFLPYVLHYLYKPNGMRYKKIMQNTMVGKEK